MTSRADKVKTVLVLIADIAGAKEAISERMVSFVGIVPIPAHDIRASSYQLAFLTCLELVTGLVYDSYFDTDARPAARCELVFGMLVVQQAGQKSGFTQAVNLNKLHVWKNLSRTMH